MKTILIITALTLTGILTDAALYKEEWNAPPEADHILNPVKYSDKTIATGKKLFDSVCWTCHGIDGRGDGPASQPLIIKPANFSDAAVQNQSDGAIYWKLSTGRGAMPDFSQNLTSTQRWQLVWYIRQFKNSRAQ